MLNGGALPHGYRSIADDFYQRRRNRRRVSFGQDDDDEYEIQRRKVDVPAEQYRWWLRQHGDSTKEYPTALAQPNEEECRPMFDWQEASYPACNDMHQWDLKDQLSTDNETEVLGQGTWRVTFRVGEYDGTKLAFKMLRATDGFFGEGEFSPRNYEYHRRDAVMYEKLSPKSQHVLHMFGHCGLSGVFELADGGVLKNNLQFEVDDDEFEDDMIHDAHWNMLERLKIATHIAIGLKEVHEVGNGDYPAFSTCDLQIDQILSVDGNWKVSDFNRGEFIRWNDVTHEPCAYNQLYSAGTDLARSPEEFDPYHNYGRGLTPAVDVYHLGSIMYMLLTSIYPYDDQLFLGRDKGEVIYTKILEGKMPRVPRFLLARKDPATVAMIRATRMCLKFAPEDRGTAAEVAGYLVDQLTTIENSTNGVAGVIYSVHVPPRIVFYTAGGAAYRFNPSPPVERYLDVSSHTEDVKALPPYKEGAMPSDVRLAGRNSILFLQWYASMGFG